MSPWTPHPVDFALHPAVLHILHLQVGLALLTAAAALTAAGRRAPPPAGHRRVHAGAGGAGVVADGGAVLVDLAAEQTAAGRQVKHLPLTWTTHTCTFTFLVKTVSAVTASQQTEVL